MLNNPFKNPLKEDKMGTFIFKYNRVRKETFSNLFSFSVLLLSFFILIGCSSDSGGGSSSTTSDTETTDTETTDTETTTTSLASTVISELSANLSSTSSSRQLYN